MIERDWYNCHSGGWKGEITDEAFAHPAKFARGLIRRIYEHCLEQGYLKPGDTVLDPFGGVALGGCDAIPLGLNWLGFELEEKFVTLGNQNIDLWNRRAKQAASWGLNGWGAATLLQGDSRYLAQVLREAGGVVSSPPYAETPIAGSDSGVKASGGLGKQYKLGNNPGGSTQVGSIGYSSNPANLGNLPAGDHAAVVSSPPYAESVHDGNGIDPDKLTGNPAGQHSQAFAEGYGTTPGQLGAMRVVSSPPYADGCQHTGGDDPNPEHVQCGKLYGVGIAGAVSSPPYAESLASDDPDKRGGLYRDEKRRNDKTLTAEYGESEGQLGAMRVVSSPPFEGSIAQDKRNVNQRKIVRQLEEKYKRRYTERSFKQGDYGDTAGQLGTETGDDFWSAARLIMEQVALLLPPDAVSVWVCKRFVKDKKIVEFSQQWAALGEACGFETIEWIRAWLIEDRGAQYDLFGGLEKRQVARKSFFRRLYESKYPENSIDWEDVIIQRRLPNSI